MKITVAGIGYVGLSNAVLLAQNNIVTAVDVIKGKADLLNSKKSPIVDKEIEEYLSTKDLNLTATVDAETAYRKADFLKAPSAPGFLKARWPYGRRLTPDI